MTSKATAQFKLAAGIAGVRIKAMGGPEVASSQSLATAIVGELATIKVTPETAWGQSEDAASTP